MSFLEFVFRHLMKSLKCIFCTADVDHLVKACPNIKELYLKSTSKKPRDRTESIHFFSSIRFQHLVSLGMNEPHLFDGSYLPWYIPEIKERASYNFSFICFL